jgi:hypothetical protein
MLFDLGETARDEISIALRERRERLARRLEQPENDYLRVPELESRMQRVQRVLTDFEVAETCTTLDPDRIGAVL